MLRCGYDRLRGKEYLSINGERCERRVPIGPREQSLRSVVLACVDKLASNERVVQEHLPILADVLEANCRRAPKHISGLAAKAHRSKEVLPERRTGHPDLIAVGGPGQTRYDCPPRRQGPGLAVQVRHGHFTHVIPVKWMVH